MKNLFAISLLGSSLFLGTNPVNADWDYWGFINKQETIDGYIDSFIHLYTINSATGEATFRKRWCSDNNCRNATGLPILKSTIDIAYNAHHVDKDTVILREYETTTSSEIIYKKYNLSGSSFTGETIDGTIQSALDDYSYIALRGAAKIDSNGNYYQDIGGQMWITQASDGTISFGKTGAK